MAQGKNKKVWKTRKGGKRRKIDVFRKKEVYFVIAPEIFPVKEVGITFANKETKVNSQFLIGRVFEVNGTDLYSYPELDYCKVKLIVDSVRENKCLTSLYGLNLTRDKLCSMVRKWYSLIEANIETCTKDNVRVRVFCIAFTRRNFKQVKKTCYATTAKIKRIRKIMEEFLRRTVERKDIKCLFEDVMLNRLSRLIDFETRHVYPLTNILIRKIKVVKIGLPTINSIDG
jgi:small subunit ribosomal protein S3Ae